MMRAKKKQKKSTRRKGHSRHNAHTHTHRLDDGRAGIFGWKVRVRERRKIDEATGEETQ